MSVTLSPVLIGVDGSDAKLVIYAAVPEEPALRFQVPNTLSGMDDLLRRLQDRWPERPRRFGFENPACLFALALHARGEAVYATHPHAVKQLREGLSTSGKKDDPIDAHAIYVFLREHSERLRSSVAQGDLATQLQARVLERQHLVRDKTALLNQLTALLKQSYPVLLAVFSKLDQDLTLAFLERWPCPAALADLSLADFQAFLREHRYPRPTAAAQLWEQLRTPQLTPPAWAERINQGPRARLVERIHLLRSQIKAVEAEITDLFAQHPDAKLFQSLPGAGRVLAPALLAVLGENRETWESAAHLAAHSGTVPVTRQSGRHRQVNIRRHCDRDYRQILHLFANASRGQCGWASVYYKEQKARGIGHATALRNLATKWLRILWRMWQDRAEYDETEIGNSRKKRQAALAA